MQTDEALAERMRAGDREALGDLARIWQNRLYRVAFLHCGNADDAMDLVQEILLAAWSSIQGYLPGTRFDAWLLRLAANRAVSWRRKEKLRRHFPLAEASEPAAPQTIPLEEAERKEAVRRALATLPDRERLMLVLRTVEGLSPQAIGEALGVGTASVSVSLSRARSHLREILSKSEIFR